MSAPTRQPVNRQQWNPWTALLGHIDKPTRDGRSIELLHVDNTPLPLLDARGATVGEVTTVVLHLDGGIRADGHTTLPCGDYPAGIDLACVRPGRTNPLAVRGVLVAAIAGDPTAAQTGWDDAVIRVYR
jgi:hypothetical protein